MNFSQLTSAAALATASLLAGGLCPRPCSGGAVNLSAQARAAAEASGFRPPKDGAGGTLRIYSWKDYISPCVIAGFEKALGCQVAVDTFDSNEAMYARLKAGGADYDIITPSSYEIDTMARDGMIDDLDHSRLPNVRRNFDSSFAMQVLDPSFSYSVPYAVTYTGLAYRRDRMPAGAKVDSWAILGCPALKGRVTLLDDMREVIGAGLMYLGYSVNSTDPKEVDAAADQVIAWRSNVRKFDSESYKTEVPAGDTWVGHGYSTDVAQVMAGDGESGAPARADIGFSLPKEGFVIAFDEMVVAKSAGRKDLAYAFINYVYDGDVAKANMEYICGPCPVRPGIERLSPDIRRHIVLDEDELRRGQTLESLDGYPGAMEFYDRAWARIKAKEARQ